MTDKFRGTELLPNNCCKRLVRIPFVDSSPQSLAPCCLSCQVAKGKRFARACGRRGWANIHVSSFVWALPQKKKVSVKDRPKYGRPARAHSSSSIPKREGKENERKKREKKKGWYNQLFIASSPPGFTVLSKYRFATNNRRISGPERRRSRGLGA